MSNNTILATAPLTTQNFILKATGTTIGNSLIFDNGTNVGIGNTNTSYTFDVSGTGRFSGKLTVNNAASASSLLVYGGNSVDPRTDAGAGEIRIGSDTSYYGNIAYSNGGSTKLTIDNSYDNAAASMVFRMRTLGTPINALTILGTGAATFSSSVTASGGASGVGFIMSNTTNSRLVQIGYTSGGAYNYIQAYDGTNFQSLVLNNTLTLAGTGAATFTSAAGITNGNGLNLRAGGNTASDANVLNFTSLAGTINVSMFSDASSSNTRLKSLGNLSFHTGNIAISADNERMTILSTGNVGIGTSPNANFILDINSTKSSGASGMRLSTQSTSAGPILVFNYTPGTLTNWGIGAHQATSGNLEFVSSNSAGGDPATAGTSRMIITSGGIVYVINGGVDGTYQPVIGGMYNGNNNETNLISSAVSSVAAQSGFRFDVSNGAGSASRTTSMTINRSSVTIVGSLSKGSGSFKIEHPLESLSETHQLVHSFIEGPQADLIYRGKLSLVNGKAQANIDEIATMTEGTFEVLCREVQCFTTNESGWDLIKGKVIGNIIYIESQNPNSTDEISWMVIGERKDKHMMDTEWTDDNGKVIVEPLKPIEPTI